MFIYDLETTGLDVFKCDIIECYMLEYKLGFAVS